MKLKIAISGIHRSGKAQAAADVIRAIRRQFVDAEIYGIVYDSIETGAGVVSGVDEVFAVRHPAENAAAFLSRLEEIGVITGTSMFIPTLEKEIVAVLPIQDELAARGISTALPDAETYLWCAKTSLNALGLAAELPVRRVELAADLSAAFRVGESLRYPVVVSDESFCQRVIAYSQMELARATSRLLSGSGNPVRIWHCLLGTQSSVIGVGDGYGSIAGACGMRVRRRSASGMDTYETGIASAEVQELCSTVVNLLHWRGPFEMVFVQDTTSGTNVLSEIKPRFPSWVDFGSVSGVNLPAALISVLLDEVPQRNTHREAAMENPARMREFDLTMAP